ncbi:MAG TPA: winged helix DNA-binding protein [Saprospiraceae bacterium]|nr:winged helix DNA-binding protein [Saprospiraceae bacterium]
MSIEEDINQQKFFSPKQKATINVIYTFNYLDGGLKCIVKAHDILPQHFNILKILKGAHPNPVTPGVLLDVMLDKTRDLTRLTNKLVKMGWVVRKANEDNRRSMLISLTEKGLRRTIEIEEEVNEWILNNVHLPDGECEKLSNLLDNLRESQR